MIFVVIVRRKMVTTNNNNDEINHSSYTAVWALQLLRSLKARILKSDIM